MAHAMAPIGEHDTHFAAIGRVIDTWAHLEFNIDQAIWGFSGIDQAFGACVTAQLIGINGRLRAFCALLRLRGGSDKSISAVNKFAGKVSPLQIMRNRCAHDPRMVHLETGELDRFETTADRKLVFGFQPETVLALSKMQNQIEEALNEFRVIWANCELEINALPDTSRPRVPRITLLPKGASSPTNES